MHRGVRFVYYLLFSYSCWVFFSYFRERPRKPIARAYQRKEGKARREGSGVKFVDFRFKRKQGVRIQGATRGESFKSLQTLGIKDELWAEFVNLVKRLGMDYYWESFQCFLGLLGWD